MVRLEQEYMGKQAPGLEQPLDQRLEDTGPLHPTETNEASTFPPPVVRGPTNGVKNVGDLDEASLIALLPRDYEFCEYVGRGGMGWVVRARHRALGRDVAIKFIRAGHSRERFLRELRPVPPGAMLSDASC